MAGERLRVVHGSAAGSEIPLLHDEFTVGRREEGIARLGGDEQISARHARFQRLDNGEVVVEDLGSTNGTYVNGEPIHGPRALRPGDAITVGTTTLAFQAGAHDTVPGAPIRVGADGTPTATPPAGSGAGASPGAPTTPAPPLRSPVPPGGGPALPPAPPLRPGAPFAPGAGGGPGPVRRRRVGLRAVGLGLLAGVVVGAIVVGIVALAGEGARRAATVAVPADCGANIGKQGSVAYVVYVESNIAQPGRNSVLTIPYEAGDMKPMAMSQCFTGGAGSHDLTASGALDADYQLITNPQRTLLFAVNQGSDSIAVFHILSNGALRAVAGSPFPSGGTAPASLGLSGNTLVVANKAQDGIRSLAHTAPIYTTFTVQQDGRLRQVPGSNVPSQPGSSPDSAYVPPSGGVAVGTEESGPIRGFHISASGVLKEAPGSPYFLPPSVFGPGFAPFNEFPLGLTAHPTKPLLYISVPLVPAVAVYRLHASGSLTFLDSVVERGAFEPCWIRVTNNGRWMYMANADTNSVTAYDLSNPSRPKQLQTVLFKTPGEPWNEVIDPKDKFLFVNAPRNDLAVPAGQGNTQHVMRIESDGKLTELNPSSPARIPVPVGTNPQGSALVPGPYAVH